MAVSLPPKGLIIDLITPLTSGREIDGRGLGKHLDRVMPHAQALFLSGPYMGEGLSLRPGLREELFEKSLVVIRGRIPVFMWITGENRQETEKILLSLKKRMEFRKYTGQVFWVDTPLYYHSNRGLPRHYEKMTSLVDESFILHNDPLLVKSLDKSFKRNNIRTSILNNLAMIEKIKGLIFSGSLERSNNYQEAVKARRDFRIYDGNESHFLEHPSLSGVLSRGANLAPGEWQKIAVSSLNLNESQGEYPDYLKQIWNTGAYLNNLKNIYKNKGPLLFKEALYHMGFSGDIVPDDISEEMAEEVKEIIALIRDFRDRM